MKPLAAILCLLLFGCCATLPKTKPMNAVCTCCGETNHARGEITVYGVQVVPSKGRILYRRAKFHCDSCHNTFTHPISSSFVPDPDPNGPVLPPIPLPTHK
jgi:hypothetical protein